jgi:protein-disulfide isomerase
MNDGGQITPYLTALPDGQFSLALGATFDPFATRSDKGFLTLDVSDIESIKADSTIQGDVDAQITWIEYSDIQCPYCAQLHNNGTSETILEKYGNDVNIVFQHFPLDFHAQAQKGAEALECIAEQNSDVLYTVISEAFAAYPNQDITQVGLESIAADNGIDVDALIECRDSGKYADKVIAQMTTGQSLFGITGTPGNVVVNNATGEYEIISGAYPASAFEEIIDRMLAE